MKLYLEIYLAVGMLGAVLGLVFGEREVAERVVSVIALALACIAFYCVLGL